MTSLCSVLSQGFPVGSSGPKVSVQMLGEWYGGGLPRVGAFSHQSFFFSG